MLPVAPGLLSVTTAAFQRSASFGPSTRARMSAPVPGVYGTTMCTGRLGQDSCAAATPLSATKNRAASVCFIPLLWKDERVPVGAARARAASFRNQSRGAGRCRDFPRGAGAHLRALLALRRPRVGSSRPGRLPHAHGVRAAAALVPRQQERAARVPEYVPPSRHDRLPRSAGECGALYLLLSRLDLRPRRPSLRRTGAERLPAELRSHTARP